MYKPGVQNSNADALSRISMLEKESGASGEIDPDLKANILQENQDSILGGHRSMNMTYDTIKKHIITPWSEVDITLARSLT
jgi:hypothetical protein